VERNKKHNKMHAPEKSLCKETREMPTPQEGWVLPLRRRKKMWSSPKKESPGFRGRKNQKKGASANPSEVRGKVRTGNVAADWGFLPPIGKNSKVTSPSTTHCRGGHREKDLQRLQKSLQGINLASKRTARLKGT